MPWEIDFLNGIQTWLSNPVTDTFFSYFTLLGDPICFIVLIAAMIFPKRTRKIAIQMGFAMLLGVLIGNMIIKNAVARPRPYTQPNALITAADLLIKQPSDYSFPSGHTLASFNCALCLFYNKKGWGSLALFGAAMIAFSRMFVFVHYPTDIICGIVLAVVTSLVSFYVTKALFARYNVTKS